MKNMLTIGITTHGNKISNKIIKYLCNKPIDVIISEDKENLSASLPTYIETIKLTGVNVRYVFSKLQGIANNRQNILDNVQTKYVYIIDNDDDFKCDFKKLNLFLKFTNFDVLYVHCYEDGRFMGIGNSKEFIYMCTWMQIFKASWLRKFGGYIQSWNFIHEEFATNINLITNLNNRSYKKTILSENLINYSYHANNVCNLSFDVKKVCDFISGIPNNKKIKDKKKYLNNFEQYTRKYIPVYRINEIETIYIQNYVNGVFTDILQCISRTREKMQ